MRKHAFLSASTAHRWMFCTPSAKLESTIIEETEHTYTKEGTLAHSISEQMLKFQFGQIKEITFKKSMQKLTKDDLYTNDMFKHCEFYVDYVMSRKKFLEATLIEIEKKLHFDSFIQKGFGTCDIILHSVEASTIEIIDLKYGKGIGVSAIKNSQLMIYGLGALNLSPSFKTLNLSIMQPRLLTVSSYTISAKSLYKWAENVLVPVAKIAYKGQGDKIAGTHCRFCKYKPFCETYTKFKIQTEFTIL